MESLACEACELPSEIPLVGWGAGMTEAQILEEHPDLETEDFPAVYQFAADMGRRANVG